MPETWTSLVPARPTGASLPDELARTGYLHLQRWLEPALVGRLSAEMYDVLGRIGWLPGSASTTSVAPVVGRQEGSEGWWAGYRELQALERFHRLAFVPRLAELYRAFFPTWFLHVRKWGNLIYPSFAVPQHQDFPAVQGAVDTLTIWIPLYADHGGRSRLRVLPGSHRDGVRPMRQLPQAGVSLDEPLAGGTDLEVGPGDVVVLHSLVVHEVTPNRSNGVDASVEYRVQDARDPVSPASLIPHHYPRIPSARVLSNGWSSRRWIRRPLVRRVERFRMPPTVESWHEVLDASGSRLLAANGPG